MSEDRNALSLREQRELLDCIAMVIIGLVYSKIPDDEVSKAPRWRVNYHGKQAILTINFDWWLPFEQITIQQIKSAVALAVKGSSIKLLEDIKEVMPLLMESFSSVKLEGIIEGNYSFIYLKNGQKIKIERYESKRRNSDHSVVIII